MFRLLTIEYFLKYFIVINYFVSPSVHPPLFLIPHGYVPVVNIYQIIKFDFYRAFNYPNKAISLVDDFNVIKCKQFFFVDLCKKEGKLTYGEEKKGNVPLKNICEKIQYNNDKC